VKRRTLAAGRLAALLALVLLGAAAGCGKKGPPLAPLVRVPAAPEARAVRRGDRVSIQVQVPPGNADGSTPGDVAQVEVYGYTGETPDEEAMRRDGTLVATIPVRRPPEEPEEGPVASAARPERPPGSMKDGFDQGDVVTVHETIGPAERAIVVPSRKKKDEAPEAVPEAAYSPSAGGWVEIAPPLGPPRPEPAASRLYMAVGVSRKGRRGAFSAPLRVPLLPVPSAPASLAARYDEKTITLSWEAPPDLRRPTVASRSNPGLLEAKPLGMPSSAGTFNAFLVPPAQPEGRAPAQASGPPVTPGPAPTPLNAAPLADLRFEEPVPAQVAERCYQVTAVTSYAEGPVQSEPSAPACAALTDTFPPAPPKGLAGVGGAGAISLIWERSEAADLAGYLVLRAEGTGEATAVTGALLAETTFRDEQVTPGVVYRYVVVAVDKAGNRSEPSNAVEESARLP
jgi:predicted small lipoprotein YifL